MRRRKLAQQTAGASRRQVKAHIGKLRHVLIGALPQTFRQRTEKRNMGRKCENIFHGMAHPWPFPAIHWPFASLPACQHGSRFRYVRCVEPAFGFGFVQTRLLEKIFSLRFSKYSGFRICAESIT